MVKISKDEKDWLIAQGYLTNYGGRYEGLVVANREHVSASKSYYVVDYFARILANRYKSVKK